MSRSVLRSALLLMLLASIGIRYQAIGNRDAMLADFDIGAAIADVIQERGLALRENPVKPPKMLSNVIYFQRPECREASVVMPFSLNYEALPFLDRAIRPGVFERRFIYLDGSWNVQDRVLMFVEWTRHAVLGIFGATRYFPVKTAIVLAEPSDCHPNIPIDWRLVWDINRYRNAESAKATRLTGRVGA